MALIVLLLGAIAVVVYFKHLAKPHTSQPSLPRIGRPAGNPAVVSGRASVTDGDTIDINSKPIRLFGIDAPEMGQQCMANGEAYDCGQRAAVALANKIGSLPAECRQKDVDRYVRIVAVCFVNGIDINEWMVAQGWALAYRHYSQDYVGEQEQAGIAKIGLWQGGFTPPWDWRHGNRHKTPASPSQSAPHGVFYYRQGDLSGVRYGSFAKCQQAKQRTGNVGVCVMK